MQTGLVPHWVWFLPLLSVVLWCLLAMPKVFVAPVDAESRATAQGRGWEQQPGEPWQHWALLKGFLTQGNSQLSCAHSSAKHSLQHPCSLRSQPWISPYRDPRMGVFLACVATECQGVWLLPALCGPFFKSHANVFSEFLLPTHL